MITVRNILLNTQGYDEVWAIVRSIKSLKDKNPQMKHVPALSPSYALFNKKKQLLNEGNWNPQTFEQIYVSQFLYEIKQNSNETARLLNYLWSADKAGKNIALCTFTDNSGLNDGYVIAGLLQGAGCHVTTDTGKDYSMYFTMYNNNPKPTLALPVNPGKMFRDELYFLSNMYPCPINFTVNGVEYTFSCSEAIYQGMKCPERIGEFIGINGYAAKDLGKKVKIRDDWRYVKIAIMEQIVKAKFTQNPELLAKLKQITGVIEENNTWGDTYWGICDGAGKNHLGLILTRIRDGEL